MNTLSTRQQSLQRWSTRAAFFIGGFAGASWAPLIPFAKVRLGLDDAGLGLILLCFGIGSLTTMPLAGRLASRYGIRPLIVGASLLAALILPSLALVNHVGLLVVGLLLFGSAIGTIDVVINIQAVLVEKSSGRPLMSGFHAFWSIGGFAGAALVAVFLGLTVGPVLVMALSALLILGLIVVFHGGLLTDRSPKATKEAFRLPHGVVLAVSALAFIAFLAEGSILDWSAVFLSSSKDMPMEWAGMGYAAFSVLMLLGRLTGDAIVHRLGSSLVLLVGGLGAAAGFALAIFAPVAVLSLAGYALVGISLANVVPVLFSTLGRQTHMPAHQAVSFVSTVAYTGILIGPAFIGFVSHLTNLSVALGLVGVALLAIAASFRIGSGSSEKK